MHMMARILKSAKDLAFEMDGLTFSDPVHTIYNPLQYAWQAHEEYLRLFPDRGVIRILHPSPASPAANHDWAGNVSQTLCEKSVWPENLLDSSKNFMARSSAFFLE